MWLDLQNRVFHTLPIYVSSLTHHNFGIVILCVEDSFANPVTYTKFGTKQQYIYVQ